jgi:hypothetical protein
MKEISNSRERIGKNVNFWNFLNYYFYVCNQESESP